MEESRAGVTTAGRGIACAVRAAIEEKLLSHQLITILKMTEHSLLTVVPSGCMTYSRMSLW